MTVLEGIPVSAGIGSGTIVILQSSNDGKTPRYIDENSVDSEIERFRRIRRATEEELESFIASSSSSGHTEEARLFSGYRIVLLDEELEEDVCSLIREKRYDLRTSLISVCENYTEEMTGIADPYIRQRAEDLRQVFRMLEERENGAKNNSSSIGSTEPFILAAQEIGPVEIARIDRRLLRGFVLKRGNRTSHAAIISRSLGIPMVCGIDVDNGGISDGRTAIVDGKKGRIIIDPDPSTLTAYERETASWIKLKDELRLLKNLPSETLDGHSIRLHANVGSLNDIPLVIENNADGIGLFRTELLYSENGRTTIPTEEEQFSVYKAALKALEGKPVIIRTLDVGGDKDVPALRIPHEENPFLGWRAIRYCLENPDVFIPQIRALLRAGSFGKLKIMFPMITSEEEVRELHAVVANAKKSLEREGIPFCGNVPLGIMIETPAAALIADRLAPLSDFFSIGTNDLTQYTLAVDRGNEKTQKLYRESHPAVLKLIKSVIDIAGEFGKPVEVCGEMGGDTAYTESLLEMGLREFSMNPIHIPEVKNIIRKTTIGTRKSE